jgi:hypothetical protein
MSLWEVSRTKKNSTDFGFEKAGSLHVICDTYIRDAICDSIKCARSLNIFFVYAILPKKKLLC